MKKLNFNILVLSIALGAFLRFYKLNSNYIWFNDTFFRITPALELLKGVPVTYDSSMIGATGVGIVSFLFSYDLFSVVLAVCIAGISVIPLSYYFVLKLTEDERMASLTAIFVSINPTLIALSKVLIWDIFVLLFFLISGIIYFKFKEKQSLDLGILLALSLFLLFTFKLPNVLYAFLIYFFLFYNNKFSIKKSKNLLISFTFYLSIMGVFFYFFPDTLRLFTGGGKNFFVKEEYLSILIATLKILASPLSSPNTCMAFYYDINVDIFFILGLICLAPVSIYIKNIKKIDGIFPVVIVLVISLFFLNFSGWSHRYLVVPLFLMIVFFSYGTIIIMDTKPNIALLIISISLISSLSPSIALADEWGSDKSLARNHVATPLSLFVYTADLIENGDVDKVLSSYGRVFTFYSLKGELNVEIVDFYQSEVDDVIIKAREGISRGEKVYYVEGWPDVYEFGGKDTILYRQIIQREFELKKIYTSPSEIYLHGFPYPSLIVYEIEDK